MIALLIPWLLLLILLISLLSLAVKWYKTAFALFLITMLINWNSECFPINLIFLGGDNNDGASLRVMCYNIDGAEGEIIYKSKRVYELIHRFSPDVVFISEYCEQDVLALDTLLKKDYPFSTLDGSRQFHYFYSKYPILCFGRLTDSTEYQPGVYRCELKVPKDTIVLYGCHLASNNYNEELERFSIDSINDRAGLVAYINDINNASKLRIREIQVLVNNNSKKPNKTIVLGDMNDVSGSGALNELKKYGLVDAWWNGGCGYGATICKPLPFRIDHILYTKDLNLKDIKRVKSEGVSDHDALYADFY